MFSRDILVPFVTIGKEKKRVVLKGVEDDKGSHSVRRAFCLTSGDRPFYS